MLVLSVDEIVLTGILEGVFFRIAVVDAFAGVIVLELLDDAEVVSVLVEGAAVVVAELWVGTSDVEEGTGALLTTGCSVDDGVVRVTGALLTTGCFVDDGAVRAIRRGFEELEDATRDLDRWG